MAKDDRILELEKQIHFHNVRYFIDNDPIISDEEFDRLTEELRKLKPDSPVLYEIVGEIGDAAHPVPMLSLDKKYTHDDICRWIKDVGDAEYIVEPKYDGMASRYQNGKLATRGNGIKGEDISRRIKNLNIIGKLPKRPDESVYGEVIIPLSYFNEKLFKDYKNPRNAVVGIVKSKRVKPAGIKALQEGGVHLVLYDSSKSTKVLAKDLIDKDKWEEIVEDTLRMDYPLDGIVIKAVDPKIRKKLGSTQHHNKWEIAYKLPAERKWSKVVDIKTQVGRIGRITNVAVIEPVNLSGATITNVTLHNPEYLKKTGIGVGSQVEITRSGEVIPYITKIKSNGNSPYKLSDKCPICSTALVGDGKYLICPNKKCPAREAQSYEYFFKVLGVEEIGAKTIERFINEFDIKTVTDFYNLKESQIAPLDGFGPKSANNIVKNIQSTLHEKITQTQLLHALGIKEIGPAVSSWILKKYDFNTIPNLSTDELQQIPGIGPQIASNFLKQIKEKWDTVEHLTKMGLTFKTITTNNTLNGMSFAITGSFENTSREKIIEMIETHGGTYKTTITKDLDYLIAGQNGGSKLEKSNENKIKIINLADFKKMHA